MVLRWWKFKMLFDEQYRKQSEYYEQEQYKMTREDAIKKVEKAVGHLGQANFVDALEALGLIKFEEEKKPYKPKFVTIEHYGGVTYSYCTVKVSDMIEALRRIGIVCVENT